MEKEILIEQYEVLKVEYIKLLNDKDVLISWGKPQLEALYATRIGVHQIKLLQQQLRIKALKRKTELVQAAINTEQPYDVNEIELIVALELSNLEQQIMNQTSEINAATSLLSNLDTPERSSELKKLFKQLAKQLHPDVNPNLTSEQMELWHKVQKAYKYGDLEQLKAFELVYEKELNQLKNNIQELTADEILLRIEVLKEGIKVLYQQITTIKEQYPFTIEEKIMDEEWVQNEVDGINNQIKQLNTYESELVLHYATLINNTTT